MKISYKWLCELAGISAPPDEVARRLTMAGLAVDSIEPAGDDHVIDFDLTSNRPDALCHIGVAREAAVVFGTRLNAPEILVPEVDEPASAAASVEIVDPDLCPRYAARLIRGVKVGPSPRWLVERLEAIGQRPVNNIADITNYVMFEMGQPTHAFDLKRLHGQRIIVRRAAAGEKLTTLDGFERELTPEMLVIADADRPVAMAGIMGGEESEISARTTDVLLESAYFDPVSVRRTSRALGLNTEASYRFERGADYGAQVRAADRVAQLVTEVAGGQVLKDVIDVYPAPIARPCVVLREARIERLAGLKVELARAAEILRALEFEVELLPGGAKMEATAPTFRVDIFCEEDLVEEVVRHAGYEHVLATLPGWGGSGSYLPDEIRRRKIRQTLTSIGFDEAISFSFVNAGRDALFRAGDTGAITLANPIDAGEAQMRRSLCHGLLNALQTNFNQGSRDVNLFELGRTFEMTGASDRPAERAALALVMTGAAAPGDWREKRAVDFYDLKGAVEMVLESLNLSGFTIKPASVEYLHPGQAAAVNLDGFDVATFGRIHPRIAAVYKFKQPVFLAEIDLERLLDLPGEEVRYSALPRLPSSSRDVSALVPEHVSWSDIENAINGLGLPEIVGVNVFDVYRGKGIPDGIRSLAFRVVYRSEGRTLTDDEISGMHERVRDLLVGRFGAQLR
ncbi:MAG TPA: phenylalanine--tRNA ligase subunit beta [Blastocatellia bacterium]|nr:phenylalanine--tRNA ligase subunit beta [Blastocatellia bacterium]